MLAETVPDEGITGLLTNLTQVTPKSVDVAIPTDELIEERPSYNMVHVLPDTKIVGLYTFRESHPAAVVVKTAELVFVQIMPSEEVQRLNCVAVVPFAKNP